MALVENWVWWGNLNPLIDEIGLMAGEELDEGLRKVLTDDLHETDTDASPPRWASCRFDGRMPIVATLGIDQGTDVLFVRLEVPDELRARAETTLGLMQSYTLIGRRRTSG